MLRESTPYSINMQHLNMKILNSNADLSFVSSLPRLTKRRKKKEGDTWDLTEQGVRVLAKGRSHRGVHSRLPITRRQFWSSVISALIIVVLHIKVDKLGVVYTERTASIVYVLTIECLRKRIITQI